MEIFNLKRTESLVNIIRNDILSIEQHNRIAAAVLTTAEPAAA